MKLVLQHCQTLGHARRHVSQREFEEIIEGNIHRAVHRFHPVHKTVLIAVHRQQLLYEMVEGLCVKRGR